MLKTNGKSKENKAPTGKLCGFAAYAVCYVALAVWGLLRGCPLFMAAISLFLLLLACLNLFLPRILFSVRRLFMLSFGDLKKSVPDGFRRMGLISSRVLLALAMALILIYACSAPR